MSMVTGPKLHENAKAIEHRFERRLPKQNIRLACSYTDFFMVSYNTSVRFRDVVLLA